jgi:hypothetical protein
VPVLCVSRWIRLGHYPVVWMDIDWPCSVQTYFLHCTGLHCQLITTLHYSQPSDWSHCNASLFLKFFLLIHKRNQILHYQDFAVEANFHHTRGVWGAQPPSYYEGSLISRTFFYGGSNAIEYRTTEISLWRKTFTRGGSGGRSPPIIPKDH